MPAGIDDLNGFEPDVIVVGSGAAGGMSAYILATAGVKVLMLEAGRTYPLRSGDDLRLGDLLIFVYYS